MNSISTYDSTGRITSTQKLYDGANFELYAQGQPYILGEYSADFYYVDVENKTAIAFSAQPTNTKWDWATKQWVPDPTTAIFEMTRKRERLLIDSDWTQIPNGPLTLEKKEAWATYRQALRDIPEQSGYPLNIVWPTPPA
jgi:hypothetical protein